MDKNVNGNVGGGGAIFNGNVKAIDDDIAWSRSAGGMKKSTDVMRQTYRTKRVRTSQHAAAAVARQVTKTIAGPKASNVARAERRLAADLLSTPATKAGLAQPYVEAISVAEAVSTALRVASEQGGLSRVAIARALACSEETLQNWARLSRPQPIPAWQMLRLAGLLMNRGLKVAAEALLAPALAVLGQQPGVTDRAPLTTQGCEVGAAAGGLLSEIVSATAGQSEAGANLSAAERERLFDRLRELRQQMNEVEAVLRVGMPNRHMAQGHRAQQEG